MLSGASRPFWAHLIAIALSVVAIVAILNAGHGGMGGARADRPAVASAERPQPWDGWRDNAVQPLARLLLQIVLVILAARLFGAAARRVHQPSVIGEMAAGIALGPSLLGAVSPGAYQALFPASSFAVLGLLSQIGVILFMFIVGLDFNWAHVRHRARSAVIISNISIVLPFLLGVCSALALYADHAPAGISFRAFGLFMGIAMSVTAFPVLARILDEKQMLTTPVGTMALSCAALNDVTAWVLLAFVVAVVTAAGSIGNAIVTIASTALFAGVMILIARPLVRRVLEARAGQDTFSKERMALVIGIAFAAALVTEIIGIHALFGAFLAGATLPAGDDFREGLRDRLESFSSVLLLPLFFAFTGLRTQVGLVDDASSWLMLAGIIVVATAGKLGGSALAARSTGMDGKNAFVLGALMNTRGLMELIALNVGYDLGVISQEIFTVLVLMAIVTTAMTSPLVSLAGITPPLKRPLSGSR
ncbi:MAG TPA: cation:proton antiporter [Vicinamibacterales bacterium]|nr:cation:proton antiporter [Vicinamibacterales bacterium]